MTHLNNLNASPHINSFLSHLIEELKNFFANNLVAIYLHGSLATGCFNPDTSDIDYLVIIKEPLDFKKKRELADLHLNLIDIAPNNVEMSVVFEKYLNPFTHPMPFEFHFSFSHKEKYESDPNFVCDSERYGEGDRDLGAHFMITKKFGKVLYGPPIDELIPEVPEKDYIDSLLYDAEDLDKFLLEYPVYGILSPLRVLMYLEEKKIVTKVDGGEWGLKRVEERFKELVGQALANYKGEAKEVKFEKEELLEYAEYMTKEINKAKERLDFESQASVY